MIKEDKKHPVPPKRNLTVREFPVDKVKLDPQSRVRQVLGDYRKEPKYIALKQSMAKFGLRNPISINTNCTLVEGFYRLNAAIDLRWSTIPTIIDYLTKKEALELEFQENFLRNDFTDYEVYTGVARVKNLHEKDFPESKRGKYDRSSNIKKECKTIIPPDGNMIINSPCFVDTYSTILGMKKTTLYIKAQIGEAILSDKFTSKTLKAIKENKITQKQLLQKLRQIDNKKVIESNKKYSHEDIISNKNQGNSKKTKSDSSNSNLDHQNIKENKPNTFEKLETLVKDETPEGKAQWELVKKGEIPLDIGYQNSNKIRRLKEDVNLNTVNIFRETGEQYEKQNKLNKKKVEEILKKIKQKTPQNRNGLKKIYICKRCSKATVMAIECECEKCGHLNLASKVLCDDDITNGSRKLRDPNSELCKNSPDYDLILKRVF